MSWWVAATLILVVAAVAVPRVGARLEAELGALEAARDRLRDVEVAAGELRAALRQASRAAAERRERLAELEARRGGEPGRSGSPRPGGPDGHR